MKKHHAATVMNIPVDLIDTAPQVRTQFKEAGIAELAADIQAHGVLQPLVVQQSGERFMLLIGERRLRAIRYLGQVHVPAIVATVAPELAEEVQLMENIQREDLSTKDLAGAIHTLYKKHKKVSEVAKRCHKSASWVSKRLQLAMGVGPVTTGLLDFIKDVELLYTFAKLEKIDGVKARLLATEVMEGKAGRDEVNAALLSSRSDDQDDTKGKDTLTGDLFAGEIDGDGGKLETSTLPDRDPVADLALAIKTLKMIAGKEVGSPQALMMKNWATVALKELSQ